MKINQQGRYSRQVVLKNWGEESQEKLSKAVVLLIGAGGLGCHSAPALCAAGIGTLIIYDPDLVQLENLHRQYFYTTEDIGRYKVEVLSQRLRELNPDCKIHVVAESWTLNSDLPENLQPTLVVDGSDTFMAKYSINEFCLARRIPWVYSSVLAYQAEVALFTPHSGLCYKCLFPTPPVDFESCERTGVAGPLPAYAGTRQAWEAIAFLLGNVHSLPAKLWKVDWFTGKETTYQVERNPECVNRCNVAPASFTKPLVSGEIQFADFIDDFRLNNQTWLVFDIRTDNMVHPEIPGIIKLDMSELASSVKNMDVQKKILLICAGGHISLQLQQKMQESRQDLMIYSLIGGFQSGFQGKPYLESL